MWANGCQLTEAVLPRTAPGLGGVGRAAAGQDALRRVSVHLSRGWVAPRTRHEFGTIADLPGTVSGAPKVRAMELIAELEKEKRGVYAGAVGYFGYGSVDGDGEIEGAMDVSDCWWSQTGQ
jgi:isochorismate synthase EntC